MHRSILFTLVPLLGAMTTQAARCYGTLVQGGTTPFAALHWVQPNFAAENVIENKVSVFPL